MKQLRYALVVFIPIFIVGLYLSLSTNPVVKFGDTGGPSLCGTGADDASIGAFAWTTPSNACVASVSYAVVTLTGGVDICTDNSIKIIKGGIISGTDQSTGAAYPAADATKTFGSTSSLWGLSWTSADINASTFGVAISAVSPTAKISHYLTATNFGFSIPLGATINGITVSMVRHYSGGNGNICNVQNVSISIDFTTSTGITGSQTRISNGTLRIQNSKLILQ